MIQVQIFDYYVYIYQKNSPCHFKDWATSNGFLDYALCTQAHKKASLETRHFVYDMHLPKKKQVSACLFQCWNNLYSMKGKSMLLQGKPFRYFHVKSLQYITNLCSNFQSYANNNYTTLTMISTCVIFGTISKNELTKTVVLFMVWCKVCRCLKIIN